MKHKISDDLVNFWLQNPPISNDVEKVYEELLWIERLAVSFLICSQLIYILYYLIIQQCTDSDNNLITQNTGVHWILKFFAISFCSFGLFVTWNNRALMYFSYTFTYVMQYLNGCASYNSEIIL